MGIDASVQLFSPLTLKEEYIQPVVQNLNWLQFITGSQSNFHPH